MIDDSEEELTVSYWPSVSDLFLTLFIISIVLIGVVSYLLIPKSSTADDRAIVEAVGTDLKQVRDPVNLLRDELKTRPQLRSSQSAKEVVTGLKDTSEDAVQSLQAMKVRAEELEAIVTSLEKKILSLERDVQLGNGKVADLKKELNDKPPIIRIEESKLYRFDSGSAIMTNDFKTGLANAEFKVLADEISKRNADGTKKVDTLEVIGHTDGQAIGRKGNLDETLPYLLSGESRNLEVFRAGSNNDLGLLRALALRQAWDDFVSNHPNKNILGLIEVRCYSAGQTVFESEGKNITSGDLRAPNEKSRRIEIRLTKLK
jgi:flagellar motor protein MotB